MCILKFGSEICDHIISNMDIDEIIKNSPFENEDNQDLENENSTLAPNQMPENDQNLDEDFETKVQQILSMGFSNRQIVEEALRATNGNIDEALNMIFQTL